MHGLRSFEIALPDMFASCEDFSNLLGRKKDGIVLACTSMGVKVVAVGRGRRQDVRELC